MINRKSASGLHPRNQHTGRYDFRSLIKAIPELKNHLIKTPRGDDSINFSDPLAVKLLNKALLACYYSIRQWDIPDGYLCPPIPGRADYIHRLADLLSEECKALDHRKVSALDIGTGANCIYPIVGCSEYGWHYTASDIDPVSVKTAGTIASSNKVLKGKIDCRLQKESRHIFTGIIQPGEKYHITTCNPPFHKSLQEAQQGTERKLKNLHSNRSKRGQSAKQPQTKLNFGGQKAELWCPGGEAAFIKNMALDSRKFAHQVLWFSTLISKKENVRWMRKNLEKAGAADIQIEEMSQGQKKSRYMAWSFMNAEQRQAWLEQERGAQ